MILYLVIESTTHPRDIIKNLLQPTKLSLEEIIKLRKNYI